MEFENTTCGVQHPGGVNREARRHEALQPDSAEYVIIANRPMAPLAGSAR
jgi:hypothetical protein